MRLSYKILLSLVSIAAFITVERFCHKQTKGFALTKIQSDLSFNPKWGLPTIDLENDPELQIALNQPYRFLGSGGQSYAFISADGKTVIKLFKHHHMRRHPVLKKIRLSFIRNFFQIQEDRLEQLFTSCKIAFDSFKEDSGLLALHLNPTSHLHKNLTLIDRLGIAHQIDLDKTTFAVQKKADLAFKTLEKQIKNGDEENAKKSIAALIQHINKRCQRGIKDHDLGLKRNFGFISGQLIAIDIGSFALDPELQNAEHRIQEVRAKTARLQRWLVAHHPEYSLFYEEQIHALGDF